jgi:hypothetical protein
VVPGCIVPVPASLAEGRGGKAGVIRELAISGCAIMFIGATVAIVICIMTYRRAVKKEDQ